MSDRSPSPAPKDDRNGDDANANAATNESRNRSRSPSPRRASRSRSPAVSGANDDNGSTSRENNSNNNSNGDSNGNPVQLENPGNNVYVANLPLRLPEAELEEVFAKFGRLQKCEVILDPVTRESRGFAFVTYEDVRDAEDAVKEMHGKDLQGRTLRVEIAKRRRGHEKTPGKYLGPRQASSKYGREHRDSRDRGAPRDRSRGRDRGGRSRSRDRSRDRDRSRGRDYGARRYDDRERYDRGRRDDRGRGRSYDRYDDRRMRR